MDERLEPIRIGLGAQDGYSGADLTSARTAAQAGEVPYLPAEHHRRPGDVLELRIHGVGGAPATVNLESPSTVQVAGDSAAGFHRAWYPGGRPPGGVPRREAYCWGELNYKSATSALWVLLLPFGFLNVAHWALPATRRPGMQPLSRAWLRLLALVLTTSYIATTSYLLVDLLAWQAARQGHLWSWLHLYTDRGVGTRTALAMLVVLAVVGGLWALSRSTAGRYERQPSGFGAHHDDGWRLSRTSFWCGERTLVRQRYAHLTVSAAVVLFVITRPESSAPGVRAACAYLALAFAAAAVVVVLAPWTDRVSRAGAGTPREPMNRLVQSLAIGSLAVALAATVSRFWWRPRMTAVTIPWDTTLQVWLPVVALGVVLVLFALIAAQRPRLGPTGRRLDVLGAGYAAGALALLAALVSAIFGGSLILAAANVLAEPTPARPGVAAAHRGDLLVVPTSVYAGALGLLAALGALVAVGFGLAVVWVRRRGADARTVVPTVYAGSGRVAPLPGTLPGATAGATAGAPADVTSTGPYARTVRRIAGSWATSELTDYVAPVLFATTLPTIAVYLGYQLALSTGRPPAVLGTLAGIGAACGVAAVGLLVAYLRQSIVNVGKRKRFGLVWDVLTFWPRAVHPFGPSCYAERAVPEVVTRIRRIVGGSAMDDPGDPAVALQQADAVDDGGPREAHSPLLLVGYSQGTAIATAVVAQLPRDVRARISLLTLAAPVHRLYGRAFPAWFGQDQLERLRDALGDAGPDAGPDARPDATHARVRWRNLVRRSDYIGGWALAPLGTPSAVDHEIYDPPVLTLDADPAPPPTHLHLDWFADPQTRPCADELRGLLG